MRLLPALKFRRERPVKIETKTPEASLGIYVRGVLRNSLFLTLGCALVLVVIGQTPWAKGLVLGGLASAANFFLMAALLPGAITGKRRRAEAMSLLSIVIRFSVMGAALGLALYLRPSVTVGACAVGLFTVQITLAAERWLGQKWPALFAGSG